jgi:hypothetical protein
MKYGLIENYQLLDFTSKLNLKYLINLTLSSLDQKLNNISPLKVNFNFSMLQVQGLKKPPLVY